MALTPRLLPQLPADLPSSTSKLVAWQWLEVSSSHRRPLSQWRTTLTGRPSCLPTEGPPRGAAQILCFLFFSSPPTSPSAFFLPSSKSQNAPPPPPAASAPSRPPPTPPSKAVTAETKTTAEPKKAGFPSSVAAAAAALGDKLKQPPGSPPPSRPLPVPPSKAEKKAAESSSEEESEDEDVPAPPTPSSPPSSLGLGGRAKSGHEDSDEEDEEEEKVSPVWVEYKDGKGSSIWVNSATGAVSKTNPTGNAAEEEEEEDEDEDEDAAAAPANSALTLGDEALESKVAVEPIRKKKAKSARKEPLTVAKVITMLTLMEKQVDQILDQSNTMTSSIIEELREIRKRVGNVHSTLEHSAESALDERDDLQALIEWDKLAWNFNSFQVAHYRAAAAKYNHAEWEFKDWHCPQYFSNFPLPPESKSITAIVRLPISDASSGTPASPQQAGTPVMTHTRINITEADTAQKAIAMCVSKCKGLVGDVNDFALKATGLHEFMYGPHLLFTYDYVRRSLRDGIELKLCLVKKPAPLPPAEGKDFAQEYKSKVDSKIEVIGPETYRNLSVRGSWDELKFIPISELKDMPFRVRIIGIDHLTQDGVPRLDPTISHVFLRVFLFHGTQRIPETTKQTSLVPVLESPRWLQWLLQEFNKETTLNNLPRATRLGIMLYGRKETDKERDKEYPLGWAVKQLIDEQGRLVSGEMDIRLWGFPAKEVGKKAHGKKREFDPNFIFRATNRDNWSIPNPAILRVKFDEYAVPVVAPLSEKYREPSARVVGPEIPLKSLHKTQQKRFDELMEADPLSQLSDDDKKLLWDLRHHAVKFPSALPKLLQAVKWSQQEHRMEAYRLLNEWALPKDPALLMEFLDVRYHDYTVREWAVNHLRKMKDDELRLCLLQLVQCVKFEPYHESPLSRFLVERALRSPLDVGHFLFWHLKSELHDPPYAERFALYIEEFLSHCGRYAHELRKQAQAVLKLQRVAELIVKLKREHGYSDDEAMPVYRKELEKLNNDFFAPMGKFQLSLNPRIEATTLMVEKCRYMSSKMVPLWLVFKNHDEDAPPIFFIFKAGDDLRQDILTLQVLTMMDKIWLANGLDMKMKPYRVLSTGVTDSGEGVGMIEVVLNSDTTSGIQIQYGGGAAGALRLDPIDLFLHDHNKGKQLYEKAVQNFINSCAGYCVATFVMGIGDRHNGNIMVTKDGHLFHIDFGHFLGNFKKKFGVNRERAAFVFTPEMAYVMGGKKYQKSPLFKKFLFLCSEAFKVLRMNSNLLENLFSLMVVAQMPELLVEEDIYYMRDKFYLGVSEKKADKLLQAEINKSLDSTYRRIDNMIHNLRHG